MQPDNRKAVCSVCWHASNHRPTPTLTTDPPSSDGKCRKCRQLYKQVNVVYSVKLKTWIELRPRPTDVMTGFKACDFVKKGGLAACPHRARCTFAHSQEELDEWQRDRDRDSAAPAATSTMRTRKPDPVLSKLCPQLAQGRCTRDPCSYPHSFTMCPDAATTGYCARDVQCPYAHSERELSAWNNWLARIPVRADSQHDSASSPSLSLSPVASHYCDTCKMSFPHAKSFQDHIRSDDHKHSHFRAYKIREAPRNVFGDYRMCRFVASGKRCDFGEGACTFAHSDAEIEAWRRIRDGGEQTPHAEDNAPSASAVITKPCVETGKLACSEQLLSSCISGKPITFVDNISTVRLDTKQSSALNITTDSCELLKWVFVVDPSKATTISAVTLLDITQANFEISSLLHGFVELLPSKGELNATFSPQFTADKEIRVTITFKPLTFGHFSQGIVFKLSTQSIAFKMNVKVSSIADGSKISFYSSRPPFINGGPTSSFQFSPFASLSPENFSQHFPLGSLVEKTKARSESSDSFASKVQFKRQKLHNVLLEEEASRSSNLKGKAFVGIVPEPLAQFQLSERTRATVDHTETLLAFYPSLTDVSAVLAYGDIAFLHARTVDGAPLEALQGLVVEVSSSRLVVRCDDRKSSLLISPHGRVDVTFEVSRKRYSRIHMAIDRIADNVLIPLPSNIALQASPAIVPGLDLTQARVVDAARRLPDGGKLVIAGPVASGKTTVLLEIIKGVLYGGGRVLVCVPDLDVLEDTRVALLDVMVQSGIASRYLLQVMDTDTVSSVLPPSPNFTLNYDVLRQGFRPVVEQDIVQSAIVVTTLDAAALLLNLGSNAFFSHVIVDVAGLVDEVEALAALALANERTRIIISGDEYDIASSHFGAVTAASQSIVRHWGSLDVPKMVLAQSYALHSQVNAVISACTAPIASMRPDEETFFVSSPDVLASRGVNFINIPSNMSEVPEHEQEASELVRQILLLLQHWPANMSALKPRQIAIYAASHQQVALITAQLSNTPLSAIPVRLVSSIHRSRSRVAFVSTHGSSSDNPFLNCTGAVVSSLSRATSVVIILGDALRLCSTGVGAWKTLVSKCIDSKSFFSNNPASFTQQLDAYEKHSAALRVLFYQAMNQSRAQLPGKPQQKPLDIVEFVPSKQVQTALQQVAQPLYPVTISNVWRSSSDVKQPIPGPMDSSSRVLQYASTWNQPLSTPDSPRIDDYNRSNSAALASSLGSYSDAARASSTWASPMVGGLVQRINSLLSRDYDTITAALIAEDICQHRAYSELCHLADNYPALLTLAKKIRPSSKNADPIDVQSSAIAQQFEHIEMLLNDPQTSSQLLELCQQQKQILESQRMLLEQQRVLASAIQLHAPSGPASSAATSIEEASSSLWGDVFAATQPAASLLPDAFVNLAPALPFNSNSSNAAAVDQLWGSLSSTSTSISWAAAASVQPSSFAMSATTDVTPRTTSGFGSINK